MDATTGEKGELVLPKATNERQYADSARSCARTAIEYSTNGQIPWIPALNAASSCLIQGSVFLRTPLQRGTHVNFGIEECSKWRFYFRLFNGSIKSPQIVEFLKALQATIAKNLLIIWDGLQDHRSKLVRAHVEAQRGRIALERLLAYVPEMNPVECIWGYLKHHAMPNDCATNFTDLAQRARRNLRSMQRRVTLVAAFWKHAELF